MIFTAFVAPFTSNAPDIPAPVLFVSNFFTLSWYNSTDPFCVAVIKFSKLFALTSVCKAKAPVAATVKL